MKAKTLPSIRISLQTSDKILSAMKKLNEQSLFEITLQQFRRLAYETLSELIIREKELPIKLQSQ